MTEAERIHTSSDRAEGRAESHVLYWMRLSQRSAENIPHCTRSGQQPAPGSQGAVFALAADSSRANRRHAVFLLDRLREPVEPLEARGIPLVIRSMIAPGLARKIDVAAYVEGVGKLFAQPAPIASDDERHRRRLPRSQVLHLNASDPKQRETGVFGAAPELQQERDLTSYLCADLAISDGRRDAGDADVALPALLGKGKAEFDVGIPQDLSSLRTPRGRREPESLLDVEEGHRPHARLIAFGGGKVYALRRPEPTPYFFPNGIDRSFHGASFAVRTHTASTLSEQAPLGQHAHPHPVASKSGGRDCGLCSPSRKNAPGLRQHLLFGMSPSREGIRETATWMRCCPPGAGREAPTEEQDLLGRPLSIRGVGAVRAIVSATIPKPRLALPPFPFLARVHFSQGTYICTLASIHVGGGSIVPTQRGFLSAFGVLVAVGAVSVGLIVTTEETVLPIAQAIAEAPIRRIDIEVPAGASAKITSLCCWLAAHWLSSAPP